MTHNPRSAGSSSALAVWLGGVGAGTAALLVQAYRGHAIVVTCREVQTEGCSVRADWRLIAPQLTAAAYGPTFERSGHLGAGSIACSEAICSYIVYLSSFALSGGCPDLPPTGAAHPTNFYPFTAPREV
jgi:hypothetical protein